MKYYVAGWDGGGTKTAMQIRGLDGSVLLNYQTDGLNFNSQSEDELRSTIHTLVNEMSNLQGGLGACEMLVVSTAGISNPNASEFIQHTIKKAGLSCEIKIVGDYEGALYGALGEATGIVLISGTGSICYGQNLEGCKARTGGWGHIIDDEGSGYAIGRDILSAAVQSYDKRIPKSILYDKVIERIGGASVDDIIFYTYRTAAGKKDIASFAPLLIEAISKGDQQAIAISNKAATALVQLVVPVVLELGLEQGELAFAGGILSHYEAIRENVIYQLQQKFSNLTIINAKYDSVSGVTMMALEQLKKRGR